MKDTQVVVKDHPRPPRGYFFFVRREVELNHEETVVHIQNLEASLRFPNSLQTIPHNLVSYRFPQKLDNQGVSPWLTLLIENLVDQRDLWEEPVPFLQVDSHEMPRNQVNFLHLWGNGFFRQSHIPERHSLRGEILCPREGTRITWWRNPRRRSRGLGLEDEVFHGMGGHRG